MQMFSRKSVTINMVQHHVIATPMVPFISTHYASRWTGIGQGVGCIVSRLPQEKEKEIFYFKLSFHMAFMSYLRGAFMKSDKIHSDNQAIYSHCATSNSKC
mmetsp:Transcript_33240/g.31696  ORF Transcript_33240/g.31696 Transcript_33240/m.31696 type:complete len:101 (-) Transcript_33240:134-436(-)